MAGSFNMDDYVDVAQRIHDFYERFPDGRLVTGSPPVVHEIGGRPFVWYHARAYRGPDDPLPGDGWAAEPVPGPTQFTKDSELMNAETAAWGRAIVALGFSTKKLASAQEVKARTSEPAASDPVGEAALLVLVTEGGGDLDAVKASIETARKDPEKFGAWLKFQKDWWTAHVAEHQKAVV